MLSIAKHLLKPSICLERATSILKLSVSFRNLSKTELWKSRCDVMLVLAVKNDKDEHWKGYLRTERIKGAENANFETPLEFPWYLHSNQRIRFILVDMTNPYNLQHVETNELVQGLLYHETTIAHILCSLQSSIYSGDFTEKISNLKNTDLKWREDEEKSKNTEESEESITEKLSNENFINSIKSNNSISSSELVKSSGASIEVRVKEKEDSRLAFTFNMILSNKSNYSGKHWRPVLRIFASPATCQKRIPLYESPLPGIGIRSKNHFQWPEITAKLQNICNGNTYANIFLEVYNYLQSDIEEPIGCSKIRVFDLLLRKKIHLYDFNNLRRKTGKIKLLNVTMTTIETLFSRLMEGYRFSFFVGIDFTASNGDPNDPISLHYQGPSWYGNPYTTVLKSVGNPIEAFCASKRHMAFAFGCSQIFENYCRLYPISKSRKNLLLDGVKSIIKNYKESLSKLTLSGPGLFAPLINCAIDNEEKNIADKNYTILLVLTDGSIPDPIATTEALQKAMQYPISVIIFGIGKTDFTEIETFCSSFKGTGIWAREILSFLRLDNFESCAYDSDVLANAALTSIPDQLLDYYKICDSLSK